MNTRAEFDANGARIFLLSRVIEQAQQEEVVIADVERRVLGFEEAVATPVDVEAVEKFEEQYDAQAFEAKIVRLIKRAYSRDKQINGEEQWNGALRALRDRDCYLLLMIERAGLKVPPASFWRSTTPSALALCASLAVIAVVGALIAFTELGARWLHSDASRFVFYISWLALIFVIGEMTRRVQFK